MNVIKIIDEAPIWLNSKRPLSTSNRIKMKIRADTNDQSKVPKIGDTFKVIKVEKVAAFYIIELEENANS